MKDPSISKDTKIAEKFARLVEIMARLRSEGGCEWDRAQDHKSLRPYLIEETYEALDALEREDFGAFCEELGDVLLQIVFHSRMAEEGGRFEISDVLDKIIDKMLRRHPHVFGGEKAPTPSAALSHWHRKKSEEKLLNGEAKSLTEILKSIPRDLPALMRAQRFGEKVAPFGFDWHKAEDIFEKIEEELGELKAAFEEGSREKTSEELGDVIFVLVQLARKLGIDAEQAVSDADAKFLKRFAAMERLAKERHDTNFLTLEEWDKLWEEAKKKPL
ncbi:MAG: nucleoside triphosphate pyrophosphohydrolase [Myxococcota bacterium]